jgi:PPP family 3-phenylpropionic acid transporter
MYCLLQMGYWSIYAAFCGYQTAILLDRGFRASAAGFFVSLGCLAGIVTQPLLGAWADRHPAIPLKRILGVCMGLALAVHLFFLCARPGFAGTAVIFALLGVLETNAYPLLDSIAMQFLNAGLPVRYSLSRGLGSLAYAVTCVLIGRQTARFGMESALITHAVLLCGMLLLIAACPALPQLPARKSRSHSALWLLRKHRPYSLMLVGGFFGMAAVSPLTNFMIQMVRARGGGSTELGWALFLMAAAELPASFLFRVLWRRFGSAWVQVLGLIFMAFKPLLYWMCGSLPLFLAVQPIQLLGFGLFTPANVYYTNENMVPEDRIQGQSLKMVLTNGLGGVAGNLTAGAVIDHAGIETLMIILSMIGVIGVLFALAAIRCRRKQEAGAR